MPRRTDKLNSSGNKRRKVIKDVMLSEDERTQSEDDILVSRRMHQQFLEVRKPVWEALFQKYESKSEDVSSEDCFNLSNESLISKEWDYKSQRPSTKLKNWHLEIVPSSTSSKDNSEQQIAEVDEVAEKNEDIGTAENSIVNESPARKSNSMFSGTAVSGKGDKKISVNKDIIRNVPQLRSRKKRDDNFENTAGSQGFISNGIIKKRQKRTYQKTNNVEKLHQHDSSRVNDTCNKDDNTPCLDSEVGVEKQVAVKKRLINSPDLSKYIPEEMEKNYYNRGLKLLNAKNLGNISQNLPSTKLDIAGKAYKQNCIIRKETYENTAHHSQYSFLNFSTDLTNTESEGLEDLYLQSEKNFEKGQKNIQNCKSVFHEETGREILKWRTEFSNFMKYQWKDFQKNPGSMLFPLPKLKRSHCDEKLSWENVMNAN